MNIFTLANEKITFGKVLYLSGETFFTLGYGDITPNNAAARALAVMEAGMGFAFLGVVIGYLPVIYNSFAAREIEISLLDARAGSPPSAAEFLSRLGCCPEQTVLDEIFRDWERWCADLLSSHISYPVLVFFRSQHSNQSWLSALDGDARCHVAGHDRRGRHPSGPGKLTFAMARHAAVDLAQVVNAQYNPHDVGRLAGGRSNAAACGTLRARCDSLRRCGRARTAGETSDSLRTLPSLAQPSALDDVAAVAPCGP